MGWGVVELNFLLNCSDVDQYNEHCITARGTTFVKSHSQAV